MPAEPNDENLNDYSVQVVDNRRDDGTFAFDAMLQNCMEATITLELKLQNMTCDKPLPVTADAAGRTRFNICNIWTTTPGMPDHYEFHTHVIHGRRNPGARHRHVYALPYQGAKYVLADVFPSQSSPRAVAAHRNDDFACNWRMPIGTPIHAAREGTVVAVRSDVVTQGSGPGNYVVIRHPDGTFGKYFHLEADQLFVNVRQQVRTGQLLARSGATGWTPGPLFSFQIYVPLSGKTLRGFPAVFRTPDGKTVATEPGKQYYL